METVTQAALGATFAASCYHHKLGRQTIVFGAICGAFPDFDMVVSLAGKWATLSYHRGPTHSLLWLTLLTPLFAWAGHRLSKQGEYRQWLLMAGVALLTHPILDIFTSYGTLVFSPFSNMRVAIDAVSVIDPVCSLPVLLILALGLLFSRPSPKFRVGAMLAIVLFSSYIFLGFLQAQKAERLAREHLPKELSSIRRVPTLANIWLWRVIAHQPDGTMLVGTVSTWSGKVYEFRRYEPANNSVWEKVRNNHYGEIFLWFAMNQVTLRQEHIDNQVRIYLCDQRYGLLSQPENTVFTARLDFDQHGNFIGAEVLSRPENYNIKKELSLMWSMTFFSVENKLPR